MDDHFDTSGVFEISKFDISKFACIRYEHDEETTFLHIQKQRFRSAAQ